MTNKKIKLSQNSKTQTGTKLKKTQIFTKLKDWIATEVNSNCDIMQFFLKTQNSYCDKTQIFTTQITTKLKSSNNNKNKKKKTSVLIKLNKFNSDNFNSDKIKNSLLVRTTWHLDNQKDLL